MLTGQQSEQAQQHDSDSQRHLYPDAQSSGRNEFAHQEYQETQNQNSYGCGAAWEAVGQPLQCAFGPEPLYEDLWE